MRSIIQQSMHSIFVLLLGLMAFSPQQAHASHAMGADLTYQCVGPNQYRVTLKLYRDCNGINAATSHLVNFNSASCGAFSATLPQISMTEITPVCPGIIGTACNGGTGTYGIQEFVYSSIVTLPSGCPSWDMSWTLCCRNAAITTLTTPSSNQMHISASINSASTVCNSSPTFLNSPTPFVCNNQPVFYNHGAYDADGDSLAYSLTTCYNTAANPITYDAAQGISPNNPLHTISGVSIDPATGAINFTPNAVQVGVMCVLVEEYRNGIKVGEIVRDIQFTVVNCNNLMPTLSGINGGSTFSTTAQVGQQLCFNVNSTDPDAGQSLTLTYNGGIPAGVFTSVGSPHPTGTFCWTPSLSDVGAHSFTINVRDDYCPIVGQNTYTYTIYVQPPVVTCNVAVAVSGVNDVQCSGNDGTAVVVATGGTAPYTYNVINWTSGEIFSNSTGIFTNLSPGFYNVLVTDANGCQPDCSNNSFTIGGNATPLVATVNSTDLLCPSNTTQANGNNTNGSIQISATGGTAPYLYSIGSGFGTSNSFSNLAAGTYQVVVMDANGCSVTETVVITEPAPLVINFNNIVQPTCGQCNGSVSLSASGGNGIYGYYLNGTPVGSTISNLCPGTYTIAVCDGNFCIRDTTLVLQGGPGFTLSATATNVTCNGDCDGTASATATGVSGISFAWSNGDESATISGLCAGSYTVTATNSDGCEQVATVVVTEPAAIVVSLVSSSNETCALNDGSAQIGVSGGSAPYNFGLANISTGTSLSNSSGQFSALNAGIYAYQVTDANGCAQACLGNFSLRYICGPRGGNVPTPTTTGTLAGIGTFLMVNPNPATSMAQISYGAEGQERISISIMDSNGKVIEERKGLINQGSVEMNISNWASATYFIVLQGTDGKILKTTRLVVNQ